MSKILDKIIGDIDDKKEWRAMEKRAKALPHDYQVVYEEIKKYMWKSTGISTIDPFRTLIDLFEESAANGKKVLDITGDDVAAFCDELVKGEKTYFEDLRKKLNKNVAEKLKK
jgi:DNA-binding ferritin-like protein (Dps family)